ncbi:MAG: TrkH family potassium uptake protein [Fibrobacterota bacterium]
MNIKSIMNIMGILLLFLAAALISPLICSFIYGGEDSTAFTASIAITALFGIVLIKLTDRQTKITLNESFGLVTLSWIFFALFGTLPLYIYGKMNNIELLNFTNCFFETMSGFTTTGATIITTTKDLPEAIESLPYGILFWRSMTQWIGGMGIIVLSLAILPLIGVGGMQLYKAEIPGPSADKLTPRVKETAEILWAVYFGISAVEVVLLYLGGMDLFDSFCHTFSTMSTGGFSPKNASVGHYNSPFIEYIIIIFMFISGANFALHYYGLKGRFKSYIKDGEFKFYFLLTAVFTLFIFLDLSGSFSPESAFRKALFQVVSICTTTGFGTADYEKWAFLSRFLIFTLMIIGGSGGSTGGGIKSVRVLIVFKQTLNELRKLIHPKGVFSIKLNRKPVPENIVMNISGFFALYILIFIGASGLMSLLGLDFQSALGSVAACMGNIGPGLGSVGPVDNYEHIHSSGKWILSFCMLLGRLEIYTVLVLFLPETWKK